MGVGVGRQGYVLCVHVSSMTQKHAHSSDIAIALFPGPAQLSVGYNMVLQAMESWVRPGNEANIVLVFKRGR